MTAVLKKFTDDKLQLQLTRYTEISGVSDTPNTIFGVYGQSGHPQWLRP